MLTEFDEAYISPRLDPLAGPAAVAFDFAAVEAAIDGVADPLSPSEFEKLGRALLAVLWDVHGGKPQAPDPAAAIGKRALGLLWLLAPDVSLRRFAEAHGVPHQHLQTIACRISKRFGVTNRAQRIDTKHQTQNEE